MKREASKSGVGWRAVRATAVRVCVYATLVCALALCLSAIAVPSAFAGTVTNDRPFLFSFDGSDALGQGFTEPSGIAVDNATGTVYVANVGDYNSETREYDPPNSVCKFSADGVAESFSATGGPCIYGMPGSPFTNVLRVAVDNSSAHPGRIYVSQFGESRLYAFEADGSSAWPAPIVPSFSVEGVAVDGSGHPWILKNFGSGAVEEFASSGSPPALIKSVSLTQFPNGSISFNAAGDCFINSLITTGALTGGGEILKYPGCNEGSPSVLEAGRGVHGVYADQSSSTGHVFTTAGVEDELQTVTVSASAGSFRLSFKGETTGDIPYNASPETVEAALEGLVSIGSIGVHAESRSEAGKPYGVRFEGPLRGTDVEQLACTNGTTPLSGGSGCTVTTVYQGAPGVFREYDSAGNLLGTYGSEYLSAESPNVAYDPFNDRVYVAPQIDNYRHAVAVFGSPASGTVPGATIAAPGEVKVSCAQLNGTIEPEGVTGSWHFEWRVAEKTGQPGQSWVSGGFSPGGSLPASSQPVSEHTCGLKGKTTFEVRLVGVSGANHVAGFSGPFVFTTQTPLPPRVEEVKASSATIGSVQVSAKIDPMEDTTQWQVETQQDCSGVWSVHTPSKAEGNPVVFNGTLGPVPVTASVTGLLPSERYCVRVAAKNGGGTTTRPEGLEAPISFETLAVPPSEAETSFVAPRVDTSAYLNARVNPQGASLSFDFEYSADNGATWKTTAKIVDDVEAREQVLFAEQVTGLTPDTKYLYRLAFAGNEAGHAAVSGQASFTTRTSVEVHGSVAPPDCPNEAVRNAQHAAYLADCRGIELVNNPDKGNQNAVAGLWESAHVVDGANTADGERALWSTVSGAPGGNTSSFPLFLAQRAAAGWRSQAVIPPGGEQFGGGTLVYERPNATPSFSVFAFEVGVKLGLEVRPPGAVVRDGPGRHEEVLRKYPNGLASPTGSEMSEDGAHVVLRSPEGETRQLTDIGAGKEEVLTIMPDGSQSACGLSNNAVEVSFDDGASYRPGYRWTATDASRVYFELRPNEAGEPKACDSAAPIGLYMRDRTAKKTFVVDPGLPGEQPNVKPFPEVVRATPDGKSVYFVTYANHATYEAYVAGRSASERKLIANIDPEGRDKNQDLDLYRWDEETNTATCVTCEATPDAALSRERAVMVSDDFSHVYFESQKQLVAGQGRVGDQNVYVLAGGQVRFVADPNNVGSGGISGLAYKEGARLSADGNVLVFSSQFASSPSRRLTADRVAERCPIGDASGGLGACVELYRYEDGAGSLECVSCVHDGLTSSSWSSHSPSGPASGISAPFALSADGGTIAFPTAQKLALGDVNGAIDIYEWRDGAVSLISDGVNGFQRGLWQPVVAGIDATGANVFFRLADPGLTGFERDGLSSIYDARIGGGFLPAPSPIPCEVLSDGCQGSLPAAPFAALPGSALVFASNGNMSAPSKPAAKPKPRPKRCAKGRVRRRVRGKLRCVQKKKKLSKARKARHAVGRVK